jgi:DHA1 family multidrug resistance protein-like MFS transporter
MCFNLFSVTVSLFLAGYCLGPFLWAPASELVGRRPIFLVTLFAYTLLQLGGALSPTVRSTFLFLPLTTSLPSRQDPNKLTMFLSVQFGGLIVTRLLAGIFSSSPLTNSGGLIADIWDPVGRGMASEYYSVYCPPFRLLPSGPA